MGRFPLTETAPGWLFWLPPRMLCGNRFEPERGRNTLLLFLMSICLMAISRDFFEIVRPNPLLSVDVFTGFLVGSLRESAASFRCPFGRVRILPGGSASLPLETIGEDCLLCPIAVSVVGSAFHFAELPMPGLDLPAEIGLSGKVVRKFGGVSSGKSGRLIGCGEVRIRGPGELGRETDPALRPFKRPRPPGVEGTET